MADMSQMTWIDLLSYLKEIELQKCMVANGDMDFCIEVGDICFICRLVTSGAKTRLQLDVVSDSKTISFIDSIDFTNNVSVYDTIDYPKEVYFFLETVENYSCSYIDTSWNSDF